jgi:hypothetical protein
MGADGFEVFQSLWATEQRIPGQPETPLEERFDRVRDAGFDGLTIDLGSTSVEAARLAVPHFARTGLKGGLTAFPRSVEGLRPMLHLAKDVGAEFVAVVGQVTPLELDAMVGVIRAWLGLADQEGVPIQFETHRGCITNDLFTTLQLLDRVPEMRLAADLSHYVLDREMDFPITPEMNALVARVLDRSDSFQGRIGSRQHIQIPFNLPQYRKWLDPYVAWWTRGLTACRARNGRCVFLCELGPPEYAITDAAGRELSDRWEEALQLMAIARALWADEPVPEMGMAR